MKDRDRLKKAERKLGEHIKVCKICINSIPTKIAGADIMGCSIAHQLNQAVEEISKGMRNTRRYYV